MKLYRHTRRSVILFFLLTPLTLCIYPIVVLHHIGKEVNRMYEGTEGYKKSMPFVGAFFLGIITLGIVPIVWTCKVAGKLGRKGYALGIRKPHVCGPLMFFCGFLFCFLIVTGIIAWTKFLHTCNAIERKLNELASVQAEEEAKADIISEEAAPEEAPEIVEKPAEPEAISAEAPAEPKEEAAEEPAPEPAPEPEPEPEPKKELAPEYRPAPRKNVRKWRVRLSNSNEFKVFDTEEEALAYAKGLADKNNAKLHIRK